MCEALGGSGEGRGGGGRGEILDLKGPREWHASKYCKQLGMMP
jgi:hypothetical protein